MAFATKIKDCDGFDDAALYKVDPPVTWDDYDDDGPVEHATEYVVVSATVAMFSGPETFIFPADADGNVVNWGELDGSFRGALDHAAALEGAGRPLRTLTA